jgi:CRP/FNR family transcriptional regulator
MPLRPPAVSAYPPSDDGDLLQFCRTCAFAPVCLTEGYDKPALHELHCLIEHVGPWPAGHRVFSPGEPFNAIYAVRAGAIKTSVIDDQGREQVQGFYLPGELVGFEAIWPGRYPCLATALDTTTLCRFSFPAMATLALKLPGIQQELMRRMSQHLGQTAILAGDHSADERLAAFLVGLGNRYAAMGTSARQFRLPMTRTNIANYLRLAPETVSRILRRFADQGLIETERRDMRLTDGERLRHLARHMLPPAGG